MPLDVSEDGEAANAEIGLLLGLTGRLLAGPLRDRLPALEPQGLAVLGPRDEAWRRQFNVGSLRDVGVWLRSEREVAADPAGAGRQAVEHVTSFASRWWLHVDLDVLDPGFPAQGLPDVADEPGGMTWRQLSDFWSQRSRRWVSRMEHRHLRPRPGPESRRRPPSSSTWWAKSQRRSGRAGLALTPRSFRTFPGARLRDRGRCLGRLSGPHWRATLRSRRLSG